MLAAGLPRGALAVDTPNQDPPESAVKHLFESLTEQQRAEICFDWEYLDSKRGLLRSRVANNWQVTTPIINGSFYTGEQRDMIRKIYEGIIHPDWHSRIDKQLKDDADGYGESQSIAIFGQPGLDKFEFVMTGRHMTMRCDGDSAEHVAFGGPIFYGHDPWGTFYEEKDHAGNVFWEQAMEANKVYEMLNGRQRKMAEVAKSPRESNVHFRENVGGLPGIPVAELSPDQREQVQKVLQKLVEPYRQNDRDEVVQCLKAQGGLDKCHLAFFTDHDIGDDGVWDIWRLEGPSFVWHFRGSPHVHVWVNVLTILSAIQFARSRRETFAWASTLVPALMQAPIGFQYLDFKMPITTRISTKPTWIASN